MLYYAGLAMRRDGRWSEAQQQFSLVIHKFRDRPIAAAAARQASWKHQFFSIQLGAFSDTTRAGQQVATFRAQGLDAFQEHQVRRGTGLWVVMAGRYPSYEEATKALNRVRRIQSDAYIIP
jgi:cell division septation protein DedD